MKAQLLVVMGCVFLSVAVLAKKVETESGTVVALSVNGTYSFKGIPFAAPPVGDLRWELPQKHPGWAGSYRAISQGNPCPQLSMMGGSQVIGKEDCLNLNIYTPSGDISDLPVMVYIHGGAHVSGSNYGMPPMTEEMYDGRKMAKKGNVIIVSVNYRLGAFGFMAHQDGVQPNLGIHDVIHSLKWVKNNIGSFGGDSNKVTIFGESAGAANVLTLLASPLAKGLFQGAIVQSGYPVNSDISEAFRIGESLAQQLGCKEGVDTLDCLRSKTAEEIVKAVPMNSEAANALRYGPVVDGDVLEKSVVDVFKAGAHNKVPVMMGTTADEMTVLLPMFYSGESLSEEKYRELVAQHFGEQAQRVLEVYPASDYSNPKDALVALLGDAMFQAPTRDYLRALAANQESPIYRYLFNYTSKHPLLSPLRAGHSLEIPYIFGNFSSFTHPLGLTTEERRVHKQMMNRWLTFAKSLDHPNPHETEPNWEPYRVMDDNYISFDSKTELDEQFRQKECDFWLTADGL